LRRLAQGQAPEWATAFFLVAAAAYSEIEDRDVPYTVL